MTRRPILAVAAAVAVLLFLGLGGVAVMVSGSQAAGCGAQAPAGPIPAGEMSYAAIEGAWDQAGGPPDQAPVAAAITGAESTFTPSRVEQGHPYAQTGWGLWQITPGNSEPQYGTDTALLTPLNNAEAAVAKYDAAVAAGEPGFGPWATWRDLAYVGFLQPGVPPDMSGTGGVAIPAVGCSASSASAGGIVDPIPGFIPGRDDMGVDACAADGAPIVAPAASTLVGVQPTWYLIEPLLLFRFDQEQSGTPDGTQYWYVAEEISPVTETVGTDFQAGQTVATFAPAGTCIEIGWGVAPGTPGAPGWALAQAMGDGYAAANPSPGELTQWGESYKRYFGIPWVGRSP